MQDLPSARLFAVYHREHKFEFYRIKISTKKRISWITGEREKNVKKYPKRVTSETSLTATLRDIFLHKFSWKSLESWVERDGDGGGSKFTSLCPMYTRPNI